MTHHCHAIGCNVPVEPWRLMCLPHWRMVPPALRADVWHFYRRGQERDKNPSPEWLLAARAAIDAVAEKEARAKEAQRLLGRQFELFGESR